MMRHPAAEVSTCRTPLLRAKRYGFVHRWSVYKRQSSQSVVKLVYVFIFLYTELHKGPKKDVDPSHSLRKG